MLLLSREDIKKVITMRDIIEADRVAYKMVVDQAVDNPLRTVIKSASGGSFLFMPAYAAGISAASLKVVNIFPENAAKGLATSPAQVLLIDGETGYIIALLDGTYVTQLRTGASSGLAFDLLARKDCRVGALIGTGGQAACQLEAMVTARDLEEVRIYSRDPGKCRDFTARMQEELASYGVRFTASASSDECIDNADLIITTTTSPVPVFDGTRVKEGATISAVGTYEPHKRELDPAVLPRASKIICDSVEAALSETGDLLIPLADGTITREDIKGSIGDVINGTIPGRENDDEIIVYETVGVGAQDLVTAKFIYDRACEAGVGVNWG